MCWKPDISGQAVRTGLPEGSPPQPSVREYHACPPTGRNSPFWMLQRYAMMPPAGRPWAATG
jgi:hypothetical protein